MGDLMAMLNDDSKLGNLLGDLELAANLKTVDHSSEEQLLKDDKKPSPKPLSADDKKISRLDIGMSPRPRDR